MEASQVVQDIPWLEKPEQSLVHGLLESGLILSDTKVNLTPTTSNNRASTSYGIKFRISTPSSTSNSKKRSVGDSSNNLSPSTQKNLSRFTPISMKNEEAKLKVPPRSKTADIYAKSKELTTPHKRMNHLPPEQFATPNQSRYLRLTRDYHSSLNTQSNLSSPSHLNPPSHLTTPSQLKANSR